MSHGSSNYRWEAFHAVARVRALLRLVRCFGWSAAVLVTVSVHAQQARLTPRLEPLPDPSEPPLRIAAHPNRVDASGPATTQNISLSGPGCGPGCQAGCKGGCIGVPNPAMPFPIAGVDATCTGGCGEVHWGQMGPVPWQAFGQGEYVGHARTSHVPEYRLRVDDQLEFVYRLTREETERAYELNVGDQIGIESVADADLDRELIVQPDGTVTLKLLGQVRAAGRTVEQLRLELEKLYTKYYREPAVTVTPLKVNTKLDDLRQSVNSQFGNGGQVRPAKVTPEGTIQLPVVGNVPVQGLTIDELARELQQRYSSEVEGVEVTPVLVQRAPRFVFVVGEVKTPGRFTLEGPTTVMQAVALAGGWNVGANLRQVVVFRRADDWRLLATMLDIRGALYAKSPGPSDEIWLNDSDIVVVPKAPIKVANDVIEQVFTKGVYGVLPFSMSYSISRLSSISAAAGS